MISPFPELRNVMDVFKNICLSLLLLLACGCSQDDSSPPGQETGSAISPPEAEAPSVVPIEISPDDREKAALAPEGMVFIKGGCFILGNDFTQTDEAPEHEVCVSDFFMDRYEVTQARWEKVIGFNPSKFIGADRPVEQINYYDVFKFIEKSEGNCRLPTEAEWEYAAGGRSDSRYYWGNMMDDAYAWFEDDSNHQSYPVGKKLPNQFGLYDMMGNVWEWTADWYTPLYEDLERQDPQGVKEGEYKVIRGGSFDSSAGALRITNRTWLHPKNRVFPKVTTHGQIMNEIYNYVGFRCAKSLPAQTANETSG